VVAIGAILIVVLLWYVGAAGRRVL
jgi:hypothetical protein